MSAATDATDWTPADLIRAHRRHGNELAATFWGVPVVFNALSLDADGVCCAYEDGVRFSYVPEAYPEPADGSEYLGEPSRSAAGCLEVLRTMLRRGGFAPPDAVDTYLLRQAIATGLQPALW